MSFVGAAIIGNGYLSYPVSLYCHTGRTLLSTRQQPLWYRRLLRRQPR